MTQTFLEKLKSFFVCKLKHGRHSPTLLQDDCTLYCEICRKTLATIEKLGSKTLVTFVDMNSFLDYAKQRKKISPFPKTLERS